MSLLRLALRTSALALVVLLAACGGGGGGSSSPNPPAGTTAPPSVPAITATPNAPLALAAVAFSAASTDPGGLALSYQWNFGDGSSASGATASHAYATGGTYTVKVTATNSAGLTSTGSAALKVLYLPTAAPQSSQLTAYSGQAVSFTANATDPNGGTLSYQWDFGDGGSATTAAPTHAYSAAGSYTVKLTVTNTAGGTASGTLAQSVVSASTNTLVVDCAGSGCAASSPNNYSGSGVGTWRYVNNTASDASLNLNIGGVVAGKKVTLLFSNGTSGKAATAPTAGALMVPVQGAPAGVAKISAPFTDPLAGEAQAHDALLRRSLALAAALRALPKANASVQADLRPSAPLATPVVGTARTWTDNYPSTPVSYATSAVAVCSVGTGRNVVIWADPNANIAAATVTALANAYCGASGAYSQLAALLGDAWGNGAAQYPKDLIQDAAGALQDINIVILNVPTSTQWAGYFIGLNNFLKTSTTASGAANSNEALAFFINADSLKSNQQFTLSALIHESTHMINFYQRAVVLGLNHDTWLEETTAMMSEDIIAPTVIGGYNAIARDRLPTYVRTGGAVSYINWPALSGPNYAIGGAFGAYLNRCYGLAIYKQLVTNCKDGTGPGLVTSYACLDTLIQSNGGAGFADDFAHFGAAIFAALPPGSVGNRYGFPARSDGGYSLQAIDVSSLSTSVPATAAALSGGYTATTHTYQLDTVAAGKTSYVRNGAVVPANTTLLVVIQ